MNFASASAIPATIRLACAVSFTFLRIAVNVAKLPELLRPKDDAPQTGPRWCVCAERRPFCQCCRACYPSRNHAAVGAPRHDAEAVVLDLVNPAAPCWRLFGWTGKTGLDEGSRVNDGQTGRARRRRHGGTRGSGRKRQVRFRCRRRPRRGSGMSAPTALSGRRRSAGSGSRSYCHWPFVASALTIFGSDPRHSGHF